MSKLLNRLTFLWIPLTFLLTTCAPLPEEGESSNQVQVTLTLQHRSDERAQRAGTSSRATEFIVVVPGGTAFSEAGPTNPLTSGVLGLPSTQITLSLELNTPLRLFIYRYATVLTSNQLNTKLTSQTLTDGAIDYGVTDNFTISSASNAKQLALTVKLQRETTFLDSAVQGLSYTAGGRTTTTNQDGLLYYFPNETIELKLSKLSLGSFTNPPSILTPYSIMGVTEGAPADNVTNLVRLLLSLDSDSDTDNGIQLNTNRFSSLSRLRSLADFSVDNLSFASSKVPGLTLPSVQKAKKHLSKTMHQKNLATLNPGISSPLSVPLNGEQGFPVNGRIGLAFAENLRSSSISSSSLLLTDNQGHAVTGTVSVKRNWLLFKPALNLSPKTTYQATASAGLISQSGQKLLNNYSWSFTTGDNSSTKFPRVIQKEPRDNATGVAQNIIPTLTFNGPLFEGTSLSLELRYSGNQSRVSCSPSLWAASVHCLPNSLLDNNTSYTATLLKDSLQSLENLSNDNISWSFTTGNLTAPNSASLQHIGEFNDNYTRDRVILLQVGEGASQYRLSDNLSTPADAEWQLPLFYPVQAPFVLSGAQGNQTVRVFYRADNQTLIDNQSLTLTYDYSMPVGGLTLPEATNQESLAYLIMAKDNLSGAWRHLITRGNTYPTVDLETWKVFPSTPVDNTNRQSFWDNITKGNLSFKCIHKPTLQAFAAGNSTIFDNSGLNTTNCASFSDFSQLLPTWDNLTFRFDNLSQNTEQGHTLWVQDRAGNIGWGYPFKIRFDNVTPDTSKTTVELDNLSRSFNGLSLKLNTTDNDTQFFLAQLDNSSTPNAYGSGWIRAQPNLLYSLPLDDTSASQQHTLSLWLRDKAGNIDNLTSTRTVYRAWLYDGQTRVDNQSNPTVNAYAGLKIKYPLVLPSSYPLGNLQLQKASDNLSVSGQWNLDNDSLIFWSTGPLLRETNYQLQLRGFVHPQDNLTLYPSQVFHFKTDNQTLNLNNGLVAYYPLDNDTLDYSGNGLHGSQVGNVQFSTNRFNKLDSAYYFDGNSYIRIPDNNSLDSWPNLDFTIHFWIKTNNCSSIKGRDADLISKWDSRANPSNYPYSIRCSQDGSLRLIKYAKPVVQSVKSVQLVNDNIYHSVSFVNRSNSIKIFIDGQLDNSANFSLEPNIQNNSDLFIGRRSTSLNSNKFNFTGILDDIFIYNRSLSLVEIKALKNVRELIPPMFGSVTVNNGSDNTSSDTLTLTLHAYDASSIVAYQITDNGSFESPPWRSDNLTPSDNVSFNTNFTLGSSNYGERQIQVRFKDQAGNISQPFSDNITRLDTTPPQPLSFSLLGTAGNDNFTNLDKVSFIDNATDDATPVNIYLSENSTNPLDNTSGWQAYDTSGTFQLSSGQGEKQIFIWFKDAAQNISGYLTDNITFDNVSPTANFMLINNGADNTTSSTVTLTFNNVTGTSHYFATDNISATTPSATAAGWRAYPVNNTDNFTLTGTGNREIRAWFKDEAGNIFGPKLDNITLSHGISYQTWSCSDPWPCTTSPSEILTSGKITGDINYNWGQSYILDTRKKDYIAIKLTGNFIMPGTAGAEYSVKFRNRDDDSSRTIIDGTTIIEDWSGLHGPANRDNSTKLVGGQTYRYERYWSEKGGGAVLQQFWWIVGIHNNYVYMKGEDFFRE